jgi:putative transposase
MPQRYIRDEQQGWRCPPGEQYAAQFGFSYRLRSSAETNWIFQRNLIFLQDYLRAAGPEVSDQTRAKVRQMVGAEPGLKLSQLLQCQLTASSDEIYRLIVSGQIYADLRAAPLAEPDQVRLFCDPWAAQAFVVIPETMSQEGVGGFQNIKLEVNATVHWDGQPWTIVNVGESELWLRSGERHLVKLSPAELKNLFAKGDLVGSAERITPGLSDEAREWLARASPEDLKVANRRYHLIRESQDLNHPKILTGVRSET